MLRLVVISSLLLLIACQEDLPAVRSNAPTALKDIEAAASELTGRSIRLGADAFSKKNEVALEHVPKSNLSGQRPATGRVIDMPVQLSLFVRDGYCYLVDNNTGNIQPVKKRACKPSSSGS